MKTLTNQGPPLTDKDFENLWQTALFVFDTNVLLNLYRYSSETSKKLIQILESLSDRIWIPNQVALEFDRNREEVTSELLSVYDNLKKNLEEGVRNTQKTQYSSIRDRHPYLNENHLQSIFDDALAKASEYIDKQKASHPDYSKNDDIADAVTRLFEGKVGSAYGWRQLYEIYEEGKMRYELLIPPGFMDVKNKPDFSKYGDLILWFQIIDKAKEAQIPIVFVSDEKKDDWWCGKRGARSGPHPELIKEMYCKANVQFYMYRSKQFVKYASKYLQVKVQPSIIADINSVDESEARKQRFIELVKDTGLARSLYNNVTPKFLSSLFQNAFKNMLDTIITEPKLVEGINVEIESLNLPVEVKERLRKEVNISELRQALMAHILEVLVSDSLIYRVENVIKSDEGVSALQAAIFSETKAVETSEFDDETIQTVVGKAVIQTLSQLISDNIDIHDEQGTLEKVTIPKIVQDHLLQTIKGLTNSD